MTTDAVLQVIIEWYARVRLASLELPLGWFGRPFDNLHELTWSAARPHKILLEFDRQILLIVTDPEQVDAMDAELLLGGCTQVTLDWQEYGNLKSHVDNHGPGSVRLVAH